MSKSITIIGIIRNIGILIAILMIASCGIFRNSKKVTHIDKMEQSVQLTQKNSDKSKSEKSETDQKDLIDKSKIFEVTQKKYDVNLGERAYQIDVPFLNGIVNFVGQLYQLNLKLDTSTNRLSGSLVLPDSIVKGEETNIKYQENDIQDKGSNMISEKKENDIQSSTSTDFKKKSEHKYEVKTTSVSWKTIVGTFILIILIGAVIYWKYGRK